MPDLRSNRETRRPEAPRPFIYRGLLHRDDGATMEYFRKVRQGKWEWVPVTGFAARKIRRAAVAEQPGLRI